MANGYCPRCPNEGSLPIGRDFSPTLRCQRALAPLLALALSSSCWGGPAEPEYPTVTGNWTGTGVSFDTAESWTFRLEESSDGAVTGSFSIRVGRLVFSGNAGGTHTYPAVSLDLDMVFFGTVVSGTYQGQVISPDSIEGRVHLIEDLARTLDLNRLGS